MQSSPRGYAAFGIGSHVAAVDVKDGKIVRIRPLPYDWKYKPEEFRPWKIEARGKTFDVPLKTTINPFGLGYKKSIYSPNRIPLSAEDGSTGTPTERGTPRTAARAATCGSPGTRLWTSSSAS